MQKDTFLFLALVTFSIFVSFFMHIFLHTSMVTTKVGGEMNLGLVQVVDDQITIQYLKFLYSEITADFYISLEANVI